jgi:hypothetical protein
MIHYLCKLFVEDGGKHRSSTHPSMTYRTGKEHGRIYGKSRVLKLV